MLKQDLLNKNPVNNMKLSTSVIAALFFVATGCEKNEQRQRMPDVEKSVHQIRWEGGVALFTADYTLDGKHIGRGRPAYELLMKRLEQLPEGSRLDFVFPLDVGVLLSEIYNADLPLPFQRQKDEMERFDSICTRKKFHYTSSPFQQTEFIEQQNRP